jgi:predicted kinase
MIILGVPASGKTTLARQLAAALSVPCLCKDDVKEALFDAFGMGERAPGERTPSDRAASKRLSEASFAALLRLARIQLEAGLSCLVEGNWRPNHADGLRAVLEATGARVAQIGCHSPPLEIVRRFRARRRHPGHPDAEVSEDELKRASAQPLFLELEGARFAYDGAAPAAYEELLRQLKLWRL